MSGEACGPHCGWCGRCTAAWETADRLRPRTDTIELVCSQCGATYHVDPYAEHTGALCRSCQVLDALYAEHLKTRGAA